MPIQIWPYHDAPNELRTLSSHGGDEDYVALVPAHLANDYLVDSLIHTTLLGCCNRQVIEFDDGSLCIIGAHL